VVRCGWCWSLSLALACGGCGSVCDDSTVQRLTAPDREHQATVVVRSCGATTDWSTRVLVGRSSRGDLVVVVGDTTADNSAPRYPRPSSGPKVVLEWVAPGTLMITYDQRTRLFSPQRRAGDVEVLYRPMRLAD
jgi:hypothetical protein